MTNMTELNREMIFAMRYDDDKIGELLEIMTEDEVNHQDSFGYTHLHFACGRNKQVRSFLSHSGINVNARTMDGWTPVMWAARWGSVNALEAMLEDGRVDLEARTNSGHGLEDVVGYMTRGKVSSVRRRMIVRMIKEEREVRRRRRIESEELYSGLMRMVAQMFGGGAVVAQVTEGVAQVEAGNEGHEPLTIRVREDDEEIVAQVQIVTEDQDPHRAMHDDHEEDEEHEEEVNHLVQSSPGYDLEKNKTESVNLDDYEEVTSDDFNIEAARAELKCPVCLDLMKPPSKIWMCSSSHLVCDSCKNSLTCRTSRVTLEVCSACPRCPTCRTFPANLRAFFAENMARALFTGPIHASEVCANKEVELEFLVWAKLWHNHDNPRNCGFSPDQERYDIRKEIEEKTKEFGMIKFIEFPYEDFPFVLMEFGLSFKEDVSEEAGLDLVKNMDLLTISLDDHGHHALAVRWHTAWNATDSVWPSQGPGAI